jgi:glycosyltransferase involved in cell wall biosynthesis
VRVVHAYKVSHVELYGGIPEVIRILTSSRRQGITSRILAARSRGFNHRLVCEDVPIRLTASFGNLASMPCAPSYPFALAREARQADVVALHAPFPLNDIGVLLGIPRHTALVIHWHADIIGRRILARSIRGLLRRTLNRADRIVVSHSRILKGSHLLAPYLGKCSVIPFGVDTAFWNRLGDQQQAEVERVKLGHPRLVLAVGRLVPYKGFDVLIEALSHIDATAIIVGTGNQSSRLQHLIALHGMRDRVFLVGNVSRERLRILLHAARVFAFPSLSSAETFGIAQLEAMATGCPIVNTALPSGVPAVARDGIEALTVPPGDSTKLAAAIGCLLDSPKLAESLGCAGQRRAAVEFDERMFIDRMQQLYVQSVFSRREIQFSADSIDRYQAEYEFGV